MKTTEPKPDELKKNEPGRKTVQVNVTPDHHLENTPSRLRKLPLVDADPNKPDQQ